MFEKVFVGGTFDEFHVGHKSILLRAFGVGERVTVGLTSDHYVSVYKQGQHRSFAERKNSLLSWFAENGLDGRAEIIAIDDPYEPAASGQYHALVATPVNRLRAEEINAMRQKNDLTPLSIIEVPLLTAEDGQPVSSTRVREGEIDRTGHLIMPDILRTTLNKPFGTLHTGADISRAITSRKDKVICTVGDVTAKAVLDAGLVPALAVIDLQVRRQPFLEYDAFGFPDTAVRIDVASGPGYISRDARQAIADWAGRFAAGTHQHTVLVVKGEEDLLTLPLIVALPVGSIIFYGQPPLHGITGSDKKDGETEEGLVEVVVNETVKKKAAGILERFN